MDTPNISDRAREMAVEAYSALILDELDEYGDVIADLTEVLRADPANANAYNNRGLAYAEIGMARHANDDYGRAIALDSGNSIILKNRAALRTEAGDADGAIADLSTAIKLDPLDLHAYLRRAEAYRLRGRDAESVADSKRAEEIRATDPKWVELERQRLAAQRSKRPDST
jgi:tetratricopeptide (TPR) repeat protein